MNKSELAACMAENSDLSGSQATEALDAMLGCITDALADGDPVTLVNFGTFAVSHRAARTGRNPQTGEPIEIPASNSVRFKPGKALRDAVQ